MDRLRPLLKQPYELQNGLLLRTGRWRFSSLRTGCLFLFLTFHAHPVKPLHQITRFMCSDVADDAGLLESMLSAAGC